jgi:hypothetical protein
MNEVQLFKGKKNSSLGGFEPPTFRLTAERANRLRHRDIYRTVISHFNLNLKYIFLFSMLRKSINLTPQLKLNTLKKVV